MTSWSLLLFFIVILHLPPLLVATVLLQFLKYANNGNFSIAAADIASMKATTNTFNRLPCRVHTVKAILLESDMCSRSIMISSPSTLRSGIWNPAKMGEDLRKKSLVMCANERTNKRNYYQGGPRSS
jgi:hypothetical protein